MLTSNITPFPAPNAAPVGLTNGVMSAVGLAELDKAAKAEAERKNNEPVIAGLAGHIRKAWEVNRSERDNASVTKSVKNRMLSGLRMRRGEYEPDKLTKIREQGGSEIYMMVAASKARTIAAWLREILMSKGTEKPWTLMPTPVPELPPDRVVELYQKLQTQMQQMAMAGMPFDPHALMEESKEQLLHTLKEEARETCENMETYMEDQLVEGGFMKAMSEFIDDLCTFPTAVLKGPVLRNKGKLQWAQGADGTWAVSEQLSIQPQWERVDPMCVYPAPGADSADDGDFIELHRMRRADIQAMKGVEGYSDDAITAVLEEYGNGGLLNWTALDSERATAEGRTHRQDNPSKVIEALQYWGSVRGQDLLDWGMDSAQVPDPQEEYEVEAWLVGRWVIKAIINPDMLGRRPYYATSWEKVPGMFWGNCPMDQLRDTSDMCNAAARAIANNMGIASGPQVWANIDRMPPGEDITNIYPWKVWQVTSDQMGSSAAPIGFFQPNSNAAELMAIYEKFSAIADEVVGVPRYMGGVAPSGGLGRTATGLTAMMNNAAKSMQQAIALIDLEILTPMLERLYWHNMKYADDTTIKGDLKVQARGASSLAVKEQLAQRREQFLQMTNNPTDLQIMGLPGRAQVLREQAKSLDMNTDKIIPDPDVIRRQQMLAQAQGAMMGQPPSPAPQGPPGQMLPTGQPVTDSFDPAA